MSNLTTEVRVNKNGVPVTKHVLAGPKVKSGGKSMPAPSLPSTVESKPKVLRAPKGEKILAHLRTRDEDLFGKGSLLPAFKYEIPYIDKWEPQVRQELFDFITAADKTDFRAVREIVQSDYDQPNKVSLIVNTMATIRIINECATYGSEGTAADDISQLYSLYNLKDYKGNVDEYHYSVVKSEHLAKIVGIHKNDFSVPHQYYQQLEMMRASMDTIEPVLPLIILESNSKGYAGISASRVLEIAEYGQQHLEHLDYIVETVRERGGFDPEFIDEMISTGSLALSKGML